MKYNIYQSQIFYGFGESKIMDVFDSLPDVIMNKKETDLVLLASDHITAVKCKDYHALTKIAEKVHIFCNSNGYDKVLMMEIYGIKSLNGLQSPMEHTIDVRNYFDVNILLIFETADQLFRWKLFNGVD